MRMSQRKRPVEFAAGLDILRREGTDDPAGAAALWNLAEILNIAASYMTNGKWSE
jgi:hypothetical protein